MFHLIENDHVLFICEITIIHIYKYIHVCVITFSIMFFLVMPILVILYILLKAPATLPNT
ncbi:hypothetical protein HanXRQr2_Chr04g0191361 [Helianthus annuus]|uniref:Uncharacterized protein n=1 Tax=Helianthus annuus TaxID=4232 RepID=A0A9K3NUD2_HELAN|nr:hypothetical protein HanXRQr2_Chr04g0191361 [Helianthus annuus]KAJ0598877.1 hypothetical protein HanHA89_Chr04g0170501 [Helianthus annuus]